jgi:hypothetical protein
MSFTLLTYFFKLGQFLALTPPSVNCKTVTCARKLHILSISALLTSAMVVSLTYQNFYVDDIPIKTAVSLLTDVNLLGLSLYPMTVLGLRKGHLWIDLIDKLKMTEYLVSVKNKKDRSRKAFLLCVVVNLVAFLVIVYRHYMWYLLGRWNKIMHYEIFYLLIYNKYIFELLLVVIVHMLSLRYKGIRRRLQGYLKKNQSKITSGNVPIKLIRKIECELCLLNKTVTLYNDMFGWPMFLMISYTSFVIIDTVDSTILNTLRPHLFHAIIGTFLFLSWGVVICVFFVSTVNLIFQILVDNVAFDFDVSPCISRSGQDSVTDLRLCTAFQHWCT